MPYGSSYRGKRRTYRRRRPAVRTRRGIYGAAATQLYKDVSKLKNLINVEFKFHDVNVVDQGMHTTGSVTYLNLVAGGDTDQTRDGNQFRMKSIQINGVIKLPDGDTVPDMVRVSLVLDTEPDGSTMDLTKLYDTTGSVPYYLALRNLDERSRFVMLKDWKFGLNPNGRELIPFKFFRKLDIKTLFNSTTASVGNLKNNALCLVLTGAQASASTPSTMTFHSRIRYVDN